MILPKYNFLFSIIIPTYNRANILINLLNSISGQSISSAEVIIIDDGSTDSTATVVSSWKNKVVFGVKYIRIENGGRAKALNRGLREASGELTVLMDDDDVFAEGALETIWTAWETIKYVKQPHYCGISGLTANKKGEIIGDKFPSDRHTSDFFSLRFIQQIKGDKKEAISTALIKDFQFPIYDDERRCPTSLLWYFLSNNTSTLFINEVLAIKDYHKNGMTKNLLRIRIKSAKTSRDYYRTLLLNFQEINTVIRFKLLVNYIRFSLHSKSSVHFDDNFNFVTPIVFSARLFATLMVCIDKARIALSQKE